MAMRVLHKDLAHGELKLLAENGDDLWHLHHIIQPGDLVHAVTFRRDDREGGKARSDKQERRRMYLGVEVEQVEYADFSDRLRVLGLIRDGPDDVPRGVHHTITVEVGDDVKVTKARWQGHELDRIQEAVRATRRPKVIIMCIDDEGAVFAAVRQSGVEPLSEIAGPGTQKGAERPAKGEREDHFAELAAEVRRVRPSGEPLIVVGPGFTRGAFLDYLRAHAPELAQGAVTEGTGMSGMTGVHEALRRGMVSRVVEGARVEEETALVEQLFAGIGRGDGLVAYGVEEVRAAIAAGATEHLLVSDTVVRDPSVLEMLEEAERRGARVTVVSTTHEAGERLSRMGGVGALLRYAFSPGPA
jgi:protein pelota